MTIYRKNGSRVMVRRVRRLLGGAWHDLAGYGNLGAGRVLVHRYFVIDSNQTDYNLYTAIGSPTEPVAVVAEIASGVTIGATGTGTPAFDTGAFPDGSSVVLINKGSIHGAGGAGGQGGCGKSQSGFVYCCDAEDGSPGGDAINLSVNCFIDNTNGNIYGGGGGGGGGGSEVEGSGIGDIVVHGGGGGGGRGSTGGGAGPGGGYPNSSCGGSCTTCCSAYTDGNAGSAAGGGSGGTATKSSGSTCAYSGGTCASFTIGGHGGGTGGDWGESGADGNFTNSYGGANGAVGSGGPAGKAVALNGNSVFWRGGNNSSQVKGAVS